ncbi:MAG: alpha/beta hydrolase [Myxococcota bacterium]
MTRLEVDGVGLEVAHHPREGAPTLVFLHEGLGSVAQWRAWPARVADATGMGWLAYSRQGYGGSDPVDVPRPLSYMHDEAEGALPGLLAALRVTAPVLYGHSDGASIALVAAGRRTVDGLRALVLEAPHVICEDLSVRSIAAARDAYLQGELRERLRRYHGDNVDGAFWGWNRAWLDPGFRRWDLRPELPGVRVPTLVVQGRDDPYGTLAQVALVRDGVAGPCEVLLLDGCGHAPHREQPDAVLPAVAAFLGALRP